jgi:hypothetical protein
VAPKEVARALARRYVWWQAPDEALGHLPKLLQQIMTLGTPEDYAAAVKLWGREAFREALIAAPPGALDERSWYFWRRHFGLPEAPPPARRFDEAAT